MTRKKLKAKLEDMGEVYFDLVWYARKNKADPNHIGRQDIERIQREYPDQAAALCGDHSYWHHGFNSGCLATVRLVLGLMGTDEDGELAEQLFPDLDT